jgi:hypothetical protein
MKKSLAIVLGALVLLLGYSLPGQAHFRGGVWIGPGWGPGWWGAPYGYGYGYGYGYPYPYAAPPVVIQQQPQEYVHQPAPAAQPEQQSYWYYCSEAKAYYPYVKKCPGGWMKVVPTPAQTPPEEGE